MPKTTNREQYENYCTMIADRDNGAIAQLLPDGVPAQFYTIKDYEAAPIAVTSVKRYRKGFCKKDEKAKITKVDVDHVMRIAQGWAPPALDDIMIGYSYKQTFGTVSGAYPYSKIGSQPDLAWTAEALGPEIERRRALFAPREGHEPCAYCRIQMPSASMVNHTIYYRDRGGLAQKTCRYCSPACGGYDQMGHEG